MRKMQRASCVIFFLLASTTLSAQNPKIDSLKSVLALSGKPDDFKVVWGLAWELFDVDNRQAVKYAKRAYQAANKMGDSLQIVKSGRLYGQLLRLTDKIDEAIVLMKHLLPIAKRRAIAYEVRKLLGALGHAYVYKAEYDLALEYYFQALALWEKDNNKEMISESLQNIGFIYHNMDNFDVALSYFQKTLAMKLAINYTYDLDKLYLNMGMCYCGLLNYDKAFMFLQKAFVVCSPSCRNSTKIAATFGMGLNAANARKSYLAKLYFDRSLTLADSEGDERYQLENLLMLSDLAISENDIHAAEMYMARISLNPSMLQYSELAIKYYRLGSMLNELNNDFNQANIFKQKYIDINARLFDARLRNKLMQIQAQFAEKQNLERIESQAKMLLLQEQSIRQKELTTLSFGVVALLTIGLAWSLYRGNQNKLRINKILDQRVKERTIELVKNRDDLLHAHDEKDLILKRISTELASSLATLKGLSNSGSLEISEGRERYYREAELIERKIENHVSNQFLMAKK